MSGLYCRPMILSGELPNRTMPPFRRRGELGMCSLCGSSWNEDHGYFPSAELRGDVAAQTKRPVQSLQLQARLNPAFEGRDPLLKRLLRRSETCGQIVASVVAR